VDFQQISIPVHQDRLEAPLEQVTHLLVSTVVGLGVDPVDVAHQQGEIALPGVQHEVVVVAHQAVGQGLGIEARECLRYDLQHTLPVQVIDEDVLAPVATGGDVIDGAGEFDAQWRSIAEGYARRCARDKACPWARRGAQYRNPPPSHRQISRETAVQIIRETTPIGPLAR